MSRKTGSDGMFQIWWQFALRTAIATMVTVLLISAGVGAILLAESHAPSLVPPARTLLIFLANAGAVLLLLVVLIEGGRALWEISRMIRKTMRKPAAKDQDQA